MTPEVSWDVIRVVLFLTYLFGLTPVIGAAFGGNYSDYGHDNKYENCMMRGLVVHVVAGVLYITSLAIINL